MGSVTSITGTSGSIANSYTYDSFGNLTASTGSTVNYFQYTGREYEGPPGLYYYRARYYDPTIGRFLNEDPIRFKGGVNFYRYATNSPALFTDPTGLIPCEQLIRNLLNDFVNPGCNPGPFNTEGIEIDGQKGGHYNYEVTSDPLSPAQITSLIALLTNPKYGKPFGPCCRIPGTGLHVENPVEQDAPNDPGLEQLTITVHIDLGNPNSGPRGFLDHIVVDGGVGHLEDLIDKIFGSNLNLDVDCDD